jgi:hypothetical protein
MIREIFCSRRQHPPLEKKGMKSLLSVLFLFAIAVIAAGTTSASLMIVASAELNSRDQFRRFFVTSDKTNATSATSSGL